MSDIFLGWDVGAWNCDRNRESRDALCALEMGGSGPVLVGTPWRGNLRDLLVAHAGHDLVGDFLRRLDVGADEARHVTIAIDTPLAWPRRMLELVTVGTSIDVPPEADNNPYLFRMQELALFCREQRPLSVVRDMIGSQSTKGIHFLHRAKLARMAVGVWGLGSMTAIETYPAAAVADLEVARLSALLLADLLGKQRQARNDAWQADVRDAITCALIAMLHRRRPDRLAAPGPEAEPAEGWIRLPKASENTA
jgi:hypothetical protein